MPLLAPFIAPAFDGQDRVIHSGWVLRSSHILRSRLSPVKMQQRWLLADEWVWLVSKGAVMSCTPAAHRCLSLYAPVRYTQQSTMLHLGAPVRCRAAKIIPAEGPFAQNDDR